MNKADLILAIKRDMQDMGYTQRMIDSEMVKLESSDQEYVERAFSYYRDMCEDYITLRNESVQS